MRLHKKRQVAILAMAAMLLSAFSGCSIGGKEIVLETTKVNNDVFMVGETGCSVKEAKLYLCNYHNLYGSAYGFDLWDYDFEGESLEEYIKDITLDELAKIVCMDIVAQQQEISLDAKELKKVKKASEEYYKSLTADELAYMEVSEGDIEEIYTNYALAEKLYKSLTGGVNREVSDDDARVIKIMKILVTDQATADTVAEKLAAGEDFNLVASTYSTESVSEETVSRGELPEELEAVAFELDNNQISDVIRVQEGFYFIKCISKLEEELTEANKANILVQREKEEFDAVYDEFIGTATFDLNDEIWDSLVIDESQEINTYSFFEIYEKNFK